MRTLYDVPAPAKLNLFLHITGQRADGYHLLQSVFILVDWADTLHFEATKSPNISREDLNIPLPADDLITRAAKALQQATGCTQGAHISIHKNLPAQAGLGGGSSDAASTLIALNRLWNLGLTRQDLQKIGLRLGADVPFFIFGKSAWVEGIGDIIRPLENEQQLADKELIVVKPQEGLDTKLIFSSPNLKRDSKAATISDFAERNFDYGQNDLQPVAQELCPDVDQAIKWLGLRGLKARMTGSGSAVFAAKKQSLNFQERQHGNWIIKDCKSLLVHPLAGWIKD